MKKYFIFWRLDGWSTQFRNTFTCMRLFQLLPSKNWKMHYINSTLEVNCGANRLFDAHIYTIVVAEAWLGYRQLAVRSWRISK
jgi:hypothetical protein